MSRFGEISDYIPRTKKEKTNPTTLAQMNTLLSNQRTYLSYLRTGFAALAFSITIRNFTVLFVGVLLILVGVFQYYTIAREIEKDIVIFPNKELPLFITFIGLFGIYYYWTHKY